jgi:RimJ/RimL family protein N-acetyltransferase
MSELIEFTTDRLYLRQWQDRDRIPFAELNADPRVMEFFPSTLSHSASDEMFDRCQSLITERGWGFWAAELKDSGEFIGFVGLHIPSTDLPFSPCVEIGWRLAYPYWGRGLASEAARGALAVGFEQLNLTEIVSFTAVINHRSQAVMKRIGMIPAGTFEHPQIPPAHPLRLHYLYRLTRDR